LILDLVLDIGNTKVKWGLFSNDRTPEFGECESAHFPPKALGGKKPKSVVYASTHAHTGKLISAFASASLVQNMRELPFEFKTKYTTPETLGEDRIAAVIGALKLFPDKNVLIVDAGSCITYDFVGEDGVHEGGMISPGLHMRLKAMHQFTGKLPLAEVPETPNPLGRSTAEAIGQGALMGCVYEIESYISYLQYQNKNLHTILTGGDGKLFVKFIKKKIFAQPNLVLSGLREIQKKYAQ